MSTRMKLQCCTFLRQSAASCSVVGLGSVSALMRMCPHRSMVGLPSDHVLPEDEALRPAIEMYAADQRRFFDDFAAAYLKLTSLGAVWN